MSTQRSLPILLAAAVLVACEPKAPVVLLEPSPEIASNAPTAPTAPVVEDSTAEAEPVFAYSPVGRKDPFRAMSIDDSGERPIGPLQAFELEQLKLIAVVSGVASPYAMVEDPEGFGHVVRRGDLIGKHWGRVQKVSSRALTVREERLTFKQGKTIELTRLEMPESKLPFALARAQSALSEIE